MFFGKKNYNSSYSTVSVNGIKSGTRGKNITVTDFDGNFTLSDFDKNAIVLSGGLKPSKKNTPGDIRTRIETIADVKDIPLPFIGMIFYVIDEDKFYVVKTLDSKSIGAIEMTEMTVGEYEELFSDHLSHLQIRGGFP